jgi:hypothetical protein
MRDLKTLKEEVIQHGYDLLKVRDEVVKLRSLLKEASRFLPIAKGQIELSLERDLGPLVRDCLKENLVIIDNLMKDINENT